MLQDSLGVESFYSSFTTKIFQFSTSRKMLSGGSIPDVTIGAGVPSRDSSEWSPFLYSTRSHPQTSLTVTDLYVSLQVFGSVSLSFSLHSFLGSALSLLCTVRHTFLPLVSCRIILSQPSIVRSCDLGLELTVSRLRLLL